MIIKGMKRLFYVIFFFCTGITFAQDAKSGDTNDDDILYNEKNVTCTSSHGWPVRYKTKCYYESGKRRRTGKSNIFRVFHGKTWDEEGRLIRRSRQYPFGSTSYKYIGREKTYNRQGVLIKYRYIKERVACFGGGIIKEKVIEYDEKGKVLSRSVKRRKDFKKGGVF
jgi:hypothetical protein